MATKTDIMSPGDNQPSVTQPAAAPANLATSGGGFAAGDVLDGRYRIEKELGRGGFGIVYLAHDTELHDRNVVIKVLLDDRPPEWIEKKFLQECEALARVQHPGVLGVNDRGQTPDGKPFLVVEFVKGTTLRAAMRESPPMDLHRTANLVRQMGQALSAAHDEGVYHRDLKPENVMVRDVGGGQEQAVIIDFGIATVVDPSAAGTSVTKVAGSPPYMAPEQLEGRPVAASDIYALGVIAYEMVTGRLPFRCESPVELFFQQQEGLKQKPCELRPELPPGAERAILRALSFSAAGRQKRAGDFGMEFARAIEDDRPGLTATTRAASPDTGARSALEIASVLFMDIVSYSLEPMEQQVGLLKTLQEVVQAAPEYQRAETQRDIISLPTGDGMALVFFGDPTVAVRCAMEIARALRSQPQIRLRMGVHTGPVYRIADINANRNVSGGAINMAQRVMDCGDAGHILISESVADVLNQLEGWPERLGYLGEQEVKHGVKVRLYNLSGPDFGNPEPPAKVRARMAQQSKPRNRNRLTMAVWVSAAVLALALGIAGWRILRPSPPPPQVHETLPELSLSYWVLVLKPDGGETRYDREMLFPAGYGVALGIQAGGAGHLYVVDEGPGPKGQTTWNTLFPSGETNGGSSAIGAGAKIRIPEQRAFRLDKEQGTETIWLIWTKNTNPELEKLSQWWDLKFKGEVQDRAQVEYLRTLTAQGSASHAVRDETNKLTVVKQRGDTLVHSIKLEHN